jgi:alanine racemase
MAFAKSLSEPAANVNSESGATLTVDLAAIAANWRNLGRQLRTAECGAVVKANAYGLGLEPVTAALARAGCRTFFVADLGEARRARANARDAMIYVLNGFAAESAAAFIEIGARPVINTITELAEWEAFATRHDRHGGAALHVDTGMNRLGLSVAEATAIASRVKSENPGITLIMSHLACAEIPDHPLNAAQIKLFGEVRALYSGITASLANSAGIFLGETTHCDLARPGAALYGINPTPQRPNPMHNVVELTGRILQLRTVERGDSVGYGATWTAKRTSRLAVASLGYADGIPRAGSGAAIGQGKAYIAGQQCSFAGRISMDLVCIDITDLPEGAVRGGDLVTCVGAEIPLDIVAASAGTIGYEILTHLGSRCRVVYRGTRVGT